MGIIFFYLLIFLNGHSLEDHPEVDFKKANINQQKYDHVPKNVLIWGKLQALEPLHFVEGELRGYGFHEPVDNLMINQLRKARINVYVDYFTPAKYNGFYRFEQGYEICYINTRLNRLYKEIVKKSIQNNYMEKNKYHLYSIPTNLKTATPNFAISSNRVKDIEKHKWPGTNIYNIKSLLDDETLKTIQVRQMASTIHPYIYIDNQTYDIWPKYRKRVYEFVASNSVQMILMLQGKRMDWVDLSVIGDYYIKKLKINKENMVVLKYSHVHPKQITTNDANVAFYRCSGNNLLNLQKTMNIINANIRNTRTNLPFWTSILKSFSQKTQSEYESPEVFEFTHENFRLKKQIDRGDFDLK